MLEEETNRRLGNPLGYDDEERDDIEENIEEEDQEGLNLGLVEETESIPNPRSRK